MAFRSRALIQSSKQCASQNRGLAFWNRKKKETKLNEEQMKELNKFKITYEYDDDEPESSYQIIYHRDDLEKLQKLGDEKKEEQKEGYQGERKGQKEGDRKDIKEGDRKDIKEGKRKDTKEEQKEGERKDNKEEQGQEGETMNKEEEGSPKPLP